MRRTSCKTVEPGAACDRGAAIHANIRSDAPRACFMEDNVSQDPIGKGDAL
jgi:hypothetical protein